MFLSSISGAGVNRSESMSCHSGLSARGEAASEYTYAGIAKGRTASSCLTKKVSDQAFSFILNQFELRLVTEAFGIEFVNVLGA